MDKQQKMALILLPILAIAILAGGMVMSNRGTEASAVTYTDGVYQGEAEGFGGTMKLEVTVEGGKIASIELLEHSETEGIGDVGAQNVIASIIGEQKTDVDVSSGATYSSNAVMEAVKNALAGETGTAEETVEEIEFVDGTYEGTGKGFGGDIKVKVEVKDGKLVSVEVLEHGETNGIGTPAIDELPNTMVEKQSVEVDNVSGATFSSKGIKEAVINALTSK